MKKLFFVFLIYGFDFFPQESSYQVELFFGTEQAYGGHITFTLSNQGQVWGGEKISSSGCDIYYYKTNLYNNPCYIDTSHNLPIGGWSGLDFTTSQNAGVLVYGYGLYKITNSESNAHFFIDYRDHRIGCSPYGDIGHAIDLWIKYNDSTNTFSYSNRGGVLPFYTISNGQLLLFWQLKNAGVQRTSKFPDYWSNCLVLIPSQTGNHPRLVWGPHPDDNVYINVTGYNIYRAINGGSFSKIAEVNSTTYTDEYFMIGGSAQAHYKVTASWQDAMKSIQETSPTNIVTVGVGLYKDPGYSVEQIDFQLDQNYPNPFNSNSVIKYSIPKSSQVTLKIFNTLGEEIETLVNAEKPASIYELNWSAANLPSGVYFYKLKAGDFVQTRKMILLR